MNNQENILTFDELGNSADSSARTFQALVGGNLGSKTLKFSLPINDFIRMSAVANKTLIENEAFKDEFVAQRPLDANHAKGLARYTLMGLVRTAIQLMENQGQPVNDAIKSLKDELGDPPYVALQPIVANIRLRAGEEKTIKFVDVGLPHGATYGVYNVTLSQRHLMYVVDGQHRREAFERVLDFLRKVTRTHRYPANGIFVGKANNGRVDYDLHEFWLTNLEVAMSESTICVECHFGLDDKQEQQLFHDLNSKGKRVTASLAFQYDHTDPINKFVANELIETDFFPFSIGEKDTNNWDSDDGSISRKDVNAITSIICSGKGSSKGLTPDKVKSKYDFLLKFWDIIKKIEGFGKPGAKKATVAAQPVVLKAIAKLGYDLVYGHKNIMEKEAYEKLLNAIRMQELSFAHDNELWQALLLGSDDREKLFPGISNYVHVPSGTNLDAGIYDNENNWVRFGSRHNDIFPRLGDTIRWKLNLKPRQSVTKAIEKEKAENDVQA